MMLDTEIVEKQKQWHRTIAAKKDIRRYNEYIFLDDPSAYNKAGGPLTVTKDDIKLADVVILGDCGAHFLCIASQISGVDVKRMLQSSPKCDDCNADQVAKILNDPELKKA